MPVEKQSSKEIEKTEVVQETPTVTLKAVVEGKPLVQTPVAPAVEEKPVSESLRLSRDLVEFLWGASQMRI